MNYLTLTPDNLAAEHICCALTDNKSAAAVVAKKEWLGCRMAEGSVFRKGDVRGKVFIEYLPAEYAWAPVEGTEGYLWVDCLWVTGSHKGQGRGRELLQSCEEDARSQGKKGVIFVSAKRKMPYLADKKFLVRQGYEVCDRTASGFELLVKRFDPASPAPRFRECAKAERLNVRTRGIDIFYTAQCPFSVSCVALTEPLTGGSVAVRIHRIESLRQAREHGCAVTSYSVFVDGIFRTHEILTPAKLEKLVAECGAG